MRSHVLTLWSNLVIVAAATLSVGAARAGDPPPGDGGNGVDGANPVNDARLGRARALVARGQALAEGKRLADALAVLREAVDAFPDYPLAFHELGCVLAEQGDLVGAQSALEKAIALAPEFGRGKQALGEVLRRAGKCPKALPYYEQATQANAKDIAAWYGIAACLNTAKTPNKPHTLWVLERLLEASGQADSPLIDEARQVAAELIRAGVGAEAWSADGTGAPKAGGEPKKTAKTPAGGLAAHAGDADFEAQRYGAALAAYRKELAVHPEDAALQYKVGATCAILRDYRCATQSFDRASTLAPGHDVITHHLDLARAKVPVRPAGDSGKDPIQRAVEALRAGDAVTTLVLSLGSDDPIAGYLEGEARLRLGEFVGATALFEEQLGADPEDPIAKGGLAEALYRSGAPGAAGALAAWSGGDPVTWDTFLVMRQREFKERVLSKRP
jgi:tetratricopeptide (TPR) repeat protein